MWISIERDSVRQVLRSPHCGVLSYLFDTTELIDCKYLNIVSYPVPGDPTATALSSSSISLSWTNTSSIYGISIERRTASTEFTEIARGTAGERSYTDEGLDPATQYFYRLRYYNGLEAYHPSGEDDATTEAGAVKYGRLYNWYAATDAREITSAGWHVPTATQMLALRNYLDPINNDPITNIAGGLMKETGLVYWAAPNTGATNSSGFNGRGTGKRDGTTGIYGSLNGNCTIWNTRNNSATEGGAGSLSYSDDNFYDAINSATLKSSGCSIRPLKDSTTLSHGETGTYTDPSGYVYRTIAIGAPGSVQEWVADNIKTEHFRNGDPIPEVTDNGAWAALETAGMCAYDNDDNNI